MNGRPTVGISEADLALLAGYLDHACDQLGITLTTSDRTPFARDRLAALRLVLDAASDDLAPLFDKWLDPDDDEDDE